MPRSVGLGTGRSAACSVRRPYSSPNIELALSTVFLGLLGHV